MSLQCWSKKLHITQKHVDSAHALKINPSAARCKDLLQRFSNLSLIQITLAVKNPVSSKEIQLIWSQTQILRNSSQETFFCFIISAWCNQPLIRLLKQESTRSLSILHLVCFITVHPWTGKSSAALPKAYYSDALSLDFKILDVNDEWASKRWVPRASERVRAKRKEQNSEIGGRLVNCYLQAVPKTN